ncbi:hypothetical protein Bca4012_010080 [Brassica carinata]
MKFIGISTRKPKCKTKTERRRKLLANSKLRYVRKTKTGECSGAGDENLADLEDDKTEEIVDESEKEKEKSKEDDVNGDEQEGVLYKTDPPS